MEPYDGLQQDQEERRRRLMTRGRSRRAAADVATVLLNYPAPPVRRAAIDPQTAQASLSQPIPESGARGTVSAVHHKHPALPLDRWARPAAWLISLPGRA